MTVLINDPSRLLIAGIYFFTRFAFFVLTYLPNSTALQTAAYLTLFLPILHVLFRFGKKVLLNITKFFFVFRALTLLLIAFNWASL
jgi:hypothetical protein